MTKYLAIRTEMGTEGTLYIIDAVLIDYSSRRTLSERDKRNFRRSHGRDLGRTVSIYRDPKDLTEGCRWGMSIEPDIVQKLELIDL